ncbi:MAG TPA: ATP-binding protein, partial [Chthonomonadaceae bacterium]|nr:ATP-binding protein [Chthonomonadaceae bacterium]
GAAQGALRDLTVPITEFEETLRRLVQRTAMIVQAEKCVIMVRDKETGELVARAPAFGMSEKDVSAFRVQPDAGISGEVYRSGHPAIFHNSDEDPRVIKELFQALHIRNGVTVPLMIEKRDDQNHLVDRITVGVLHCLNKRYGGEFIEEDVRLLQRLSHNAAAVIANAQAFQEILVEKQKLAHTLESLTAGLILINRQGHIAQMNAQARVMFGVPDHQDPKGRLLADIVQDAACMQVLQCQIADAERPAAENPQEEEQTPQNEISLYDQDGEEFIYQVHAAAVRDDADRPIGIAFLFNDVTEIRNVERMKTEFVSIVSHELRTPLTPMKGFIRTLLDDPDEEIYNREDRLEFYGIIDANVDRLKRLIDDLLNVSRIEKKGVEGIEMNFKEQDLRTAVEEVVAMQKGQTDRHDLVIDFQPEHITAEADPDLIQNILQNLVSNAIKYSPNGGQVRIVGRLEPDRESVLMGVKDQGLGIPEAAQKKLFTKFFRVDNKNSRKVGGTGIGLYLVKNLVEAHRGTIWAESEVNKGSTFWVRIPIHQPREAPACEATLPPS